MLVARNMLAGISAAGIFLMAGEAWSQQNRVENDKNTPLVLNIEQKPETGSKTEASPASADAIDLDAVTITATRQATQVLDVPGTVTVISRQQLDRHQVNNAQDLVRYQPGINVDRQTSGTDPFGNIGGFRIRGVSGNRVQIQVDGTRIQEQIQDGNRNFIDFPTAKAIEIIRGPGSVLWGADALGGIVAFRTLDPDDLLTGRDKPVAGRVETDFDSFNNAFSKTGMAAFQFSPTLQGLVVVNHKSYSEAKLGNARADGGRWGCPRVPDAIRCNELNPLDADVTNVLTKLVWRPTTEHEVKLTGELFDSVGNISQLYDYGLQANKSFNGDYLREQHQQRQRVSLSHSWDVGVVVLDNVRWQLSYSPQKRTITSNRYQINTSRQLVHTFTKNEYEEDFLQADLQMTSHFDLAGTKHTLTYGFQGDITETDYSTRSIVNNYTKRTSVATQGNSFANATTTRADIFLQDEIKLFDGRLSITPGIRWANYNIDPRPGAAYQTIEGKEPKGLDSSRLVPQIGAIYKLTEIYSIYARYAEGFKMPTAQQLYTSTPGTTFDLIPNGSLKPETVRSYEGGVRGQFEQAWFSVGGFYAEYNDFIQNFYEIQPNVYTYRNLSRVNIWGIEASAEWRFHENWALNGSLSYQYGKQRAEVGEAYTAYDGVSPFSSTVGLKWMKSEWGLEAEFIGTFAQGISRTSVPDGYKTGGYAVFDSYVNWKINDTFTVRAAMLNILDTRYFKGPLAYSFTATPASSATAATNPIELQTAPGRTFKLSAVANF